MALSFFRKHRKYFIVLVVAAVFTMVTWGALSKGPEAWSVIKTWITGENPRNPTVLRMYGEGVTRSEWWNTRANLERGVKFMGFVQALKRMPGDQRMRAWQIARAMERYLTQETVLGRYAETSLIKDEKVRNETQKRLVTATVALMHEARRAGVVVTNEMVSDQIREWTAAGMTNPMMNALKINVLDNSPYWSTELFAMLRQEMTLSIYLEAAAKDAMIMKEDVDESFRRITERIDVATVVLKAADFADKAAEPSEEEIVEQYEKYRDNLPGDRGRPFGYKIPDRIQFKYLVVDAAVVAKDVTVTEDDIKDYYEKNKDQLYVVEEPKEEQKKQGQNKEDKKAESTGTEPEGGQTPPETGKDGTGQADDTSAEGAKAPGKGEPPADDKEPAKTLDAPQATPDDGAAAKPESAEPAPSEPAPASPPVESESTDETPAPTANESDAGQAEAQPTEPGTPEAPEAPQKPEKPEKPKTYKPLKDVRESIEKQLRQTRIRELTSQKATEALDRLRQQPRLSLENVADGKCVKVYQSKGFVTAEEAREAKGIGSAYRRSAGRSGWTDFASLAFSIAPLTDEPEVYLKRPVGVLYGTETDDQYIFSVTAVDPAHQPKSLDEVRDKVVADLKKVAGYTLAAAEARVILAEARAEGLTKAAEARKLTVETDEVTATALGRNPITEAVLDAVDAHETHGKVETDDFDSVTVFEVTAVEHAKEGRYLAVRGRLSAQVIRFRQQMFKRWFTKPEMVIRRCGLTETDERIDARDKIAS